MALYHKGLEDRNPLKTCGMGQGSLWTTENSSVSLNRKEFKKGY